VSALSAAQASIAPGPLTGVCVLVTRPEHQSDTLCRLIRAEGGDAEALPTIAIEGLADAPARIAALGPLAAFHAAVFVSANAVAQAIPHLGLMEGAGAASMIAVGPGTARALRERGVAGVRLPDDGADSEAVLRLPELLSPDGKRVAIFAGVGGRSHLPDTLRSRGAEVTVVEIYRRAVPRAVPEPALRRILDGRVHAITGTSSEGLRNLYRDMLPPEAAARLRTVLHVVSHPRIAQTARDCGATDVLLADAGDDAILDSLVARLGGHADSGTGS
jgi:uroporphyrinogen-III synthase